jgi:hypothetical protein
MGHGGGLDANGCHTNRKTGDYHCHRAPASRLSEPIKTKRPSPAPRAAPLLTPPAAAKTKAVEVLLISSEGHQYATTCNKSGFTLKSKYPVSRFTGSGAGTDVVTKQEVILLGRSCDALNDNLGTGTWCAANGGVSLSFDGHDIGFPRQEITCDKNPDLGSACGC